MSGDLGTRFGFACFPCPHVPSSAPTTVHENCANRAGQKDATEALCRPNMSFGTPPPASSHLPYVLLTKQSFSYTRPGLGRASGTRSWRRPSCAMLGYESARATSNTLRGRPQLGGTHVYQCRHPTLSQRSLQIRSWCFSMRYWPRACWSRQRPVARMFQIDWT